eukprot:gene6574-8884_t
MLLERLSAEQKRNITIAFIRKVSVITGPPGTGKTRTIAAIAELATSWKRRVLIMAPANAASRRILESIEGTGFEDACLLVSQEYFYEWHQSSYEGSVKDYVHTREYCEMTSHHHHDNRHQQSKSS